MHSFGSGCPKGSVSNLDFRSVSQQVGASSGPVRRTSQSQRIPNLWPKLCGLELRTADLTPIGPAGWLVCGFAKQSSWYLHPGVDSDFRNNQGAHLQTCPWLWVSVVPFIHPGFDYGSLDRSKWNQENAEVLLPRAPLWLPSFDPDPF